jgi:hypothetical protein
MSKQPDEKPKDEWIVEVEIHNKDMTFSVQRIYALDKDGMNKALANIPFITVEGKDELGAFSAASSRLHCLGINPVA